MLLDYDVRYALTENGLTQFAYGGYEHFYLVRECSDSVYPLEVSYDFGKRTVYGEKVMDCYNKEKEVVCADCANRELDDPDTNYLLIVQTLINWNNPSVFCSICNRHIHSEYGSDNE